MSGSAGIRGYLLQTLISVLDSLVTDNEWDSLTLEPDLGSDKVDISWFYAAKGETKVTQVKSSQNQINVPQARQWAHELQSSFSATSYELILIGPCSQGVIDLKRIDRVDIPIPKVLDISGLVEQSAHRLDKYLEDKGLSRTPPFVREILVGSLVTKFETYSTVGVPISRNDLHQLIINWLLTLYPPSVNEAAQMQCDILVDTIVFAVPSGPSHNSMAILLPLTSVNYGVRTAIIEWIAIKVESDGILKLYTPIGIVDYERFIQGHRQLHSENVKSNFSEFAVPKDSSKELCILFSQEENNPVYPFSLWTSGHYSFRVYVKYREKSIPMMQKELELEVSQIIIDNYFQGISSACSVREINLW